MPVSSHKNKEKETIPRSRATVADSGRLPVRSKAILTAKGAKDRELYLEWVAMPAMVRMLPLPELAKMGYDVEDPVFLKMYQIRSKKDFCKEFGVGVNQPTIWEKDPRFHEEANSLSNRSYIMKHKKEVDFSFTQKVIRHGDAARTKLWYQKNEGWSERTEAVNVNLNLTTADFVKEIEERNKRLRGEVELSPSSHRKGGDTKG